MSNDERTAYVAAIAGEAAAREAQEDADRHAYEEVQLRELAERGDYLGDGVYATFDGYQVWLKCQRDGQEHSVALEPIVLTNLTRYVRHFYPAFGRDER